jgi:PAS domain-containing protein
MTHNPSVLDADLLGVFGADGDAITDVEARARLFFPHTPFIVWEGDPTTFAFTYVGGDAEAMLGYAAAQWVDGPTFWADHVVHPQDRSDAIAYCALATGRKRDHVFEYRAITQGQDVVWLRDYVRVIVGPRGVPVRLRGLMFDVSEERWMAKASEKEASLRLPSLADLEDAAQLRGRQRATHDEVLLHDAPADEVLLDDPL